MNIFNDLFTHKFESDHNHLNNERAPAYEFWKDLVVSEKSSSPTDRKLGKHEYLYGIVTY